MSVASYDTVLETVPFHHSWIEWHQRGEFASRADIPRLLSSGTLEFLCFLFLLPCLPCLQRTLLIKQRRQRIAACCSIDERGLCGTYRHTFLLKYVTHHSNNHIVRSMHLNRGDLSSHVTCSQAPGPCAPRKASLEQSRVAFAPSSVS